MLVVVRCNPVEGSVKVIDALATVAPDESVKLLKTLSKTVADYGQLLKSDNLLNDDLRFQQVDAVDVVPRTP